MEKFKFLKKENVSKLPENPGVYAFKNGRKFLYIGKAANIKERVKNHFQQPGFRNSLFINKAKKIGYLKTDSEIEALIFEANLIKKYQPKYNVIWRDDKNYFFVGITKEDFPRVFITHQAKIKSQKSKVKSQFIGPFVDGRALKFSLKSLRKVFPYRSCKILPKRPCLWYQLGRCPAPCLLKSNLAREINFKIKMKKECQKNAKNLLKILKGGKREVLKDLKMEMKKASRVKDFERAARIRDQVFALEKVLENAKIFEPTEPTRKIGWPKIQKILQKVLKTKKKISRIEAYDISNIQGQKATGAMVTFIDGQPDKNFYRRFKIKIFGKPDDIAMIKEVLSRRFKHLEWGLPDLILIDGGIAQLNAALRIKNQESRIKNIKIMSLAKTGNKLYIENQKKALLLKNLSREIFNLILQLRDEAHRFALSY
ncbi:MAG: GIY-YIG nuclease family protein, partial [Candidatus Paceibacterales bacterium]